MNKGTINTRIIKRSILKHIARTEIASAGVGNDYSVLEVEASRFAVIMGEGFSQLSGEIAFIRAINNLAMSGASPDRISIDLLAGTDCPEQKIRAEMGRLVEITKARGIVIIGGNSVCCGEGDGLTILITAYGRTDTNRLKSLNRRIDIGDKVVVFGSAGLCGASLIATHKTGEMKSRFADSYIRKTVYAPENFDIIDTAMRFIDAGAKYIHDVSFGGVYRSIFEVAERSGHGVSIIHEKLPIRQDTIEICEFWNINPYQLLGTGCLVAVFSEKDIDKIKETADITFSVVGEITEAGERVVISERSDMKRSLTYYEGDEIYKIMREV